MLHSTFFLFDVGLLYLCVVGYVVFEENVGGELPISV